MKFRYEIPPSFWGLFRSVNREIYIEALLAINEEYQYSNYFLSREVCLQVLSDLCSSNVFLYELEELSEEEVNLSVPRRILNWLIRFGWLRKVDDYNTMVTNIVIPDYAAVMLEAFDHLVNEPEEDAQVFIQNIYATLFSFRSDSRMNLAMLQTALVNTRKLNKTLQDMLHNMDSFFEKLLNVKSYSDLLQEHLDGYVEEIVRKKYHILKTSDNFYIYKMDIKRCLADMREDEDWIRQVRAKQPVPEREETGVRKRRPADVLELIELIERGFDDIEHRIANMDREHSKYVRATVSRLNYLLREENDRKGLMVQLLNTLGKDEGNLQEERLTEVAKRLNLSGFDILHESPLYKRKDPRKFEDLVEVMEEPAELDRSEVLKLNQIQRRFSRQDIEQFVEAQMEDGILSTSDLSVEDEETFDKLILAYDLCMRKNSKYEVRVSDKQLHNGKFSYPKLIFSRKDSLSAEERTES